MCALLNTCSLHGEVPVIPDPKGFGAMTPIDQVLKRFALMASVDHCHRAVEELRVYRARTTVTIP